MEVPTTLREVAIRQVERDTSLALDLAARQESRAQGVGSAISSLLTASSIAIASNDSLGQRVHDEGLALAVFAAASWFIALCVSLYIAWPRSIDFAHPDGAKFLTEAGVGHGTFNQNAELGSVVQQILSEFDAIAIRQYESVVSSLRVRGRCLIGGYLMLATGTGAAVLLAIRLL